MLALFSCCCGLRHRPRVPPDERTPLIPHSDDAPTPQPRVVDHQKLKVRLGSVVRAKEGKMVNVNAQFPFNLHPEHPSRSSRNVSAGSRAASPSPHRALHRSPSTASLPDPEDVAHYLPLVANTAILNVHLVKAPRSAHSARGRSQRSGDPNSRSPAPDSQLPPDEDQTLPVDPGTPPSPEDFNIHDAGAVARSWGD